MRDSLCMVLDATLGTMNVRMTLVVCILPDV